MAEFLGDPVVHVDINRFPFPDEAFDVVIVIDVHEHFADLSGINGEIRRVLAPGGLAIITTPNGDTRLPVAALKRVVGMGPATYGHVVQGYRIRELEGMFRSVDDAPGGKRRLFTLLHRARGARHQLRLREGARPQEGAPAGDGGHHRSDLTQGARGRAQGVPHLLAHLSLHVSLLAVRQVDSGRGGYAVAVAARK